MYVQRILGLIIQMQSGSNPDRETKNITNWNKAPDKDADYDDLTPEVQEAAKSYFEHLGKAAPINKKSNGPTKI